MPSALTVMPILIFFIVHFMHCPCFIWKSPRLQRFSCYLGYVPKMGFAKKLTYAITIKFQLIPICKLLIMYTFYYMYVLYF